MIKSYVGVTRVGVLLIFLLALSFALVACPFPFEPAITIRVHNQTDKTLQIFYWDETFIDNAVPGGEVKFEVDAILSKYKIIAKDMDGNVVYSVNFTGDDIKGKKTYDVYFPPKGKGVEHSDNVTGK